MTDDNPVILRDPNDTTVIETDIEEDGWFEQTQDVLMPAPGQVVDVSQPGVILRFGDLHFPATLALEALARAGQNHTATLPAIGDIASEEQYRAAIAQQGGQLYDGVLPLMEEQVWGYKREASEDVLPADLTQLPTLPAIGEIKALAPIIDPVVVRVFEEAQKQGPRLIACTPPNTPRPSKLYVAEFQPTAVLSRIDNEYFQLNVPYVIAAYAPQWGTLYLRCRTRPLGENDQQTYYFPFPHVYGAQMGHVCITMTDHKQYAKMDPLDAVSAAVGHYWQTGYHYYTDAQGHAAIAASNAEINQIHGQRGRNVKEVFKWWEMLTFEQVLTLPYEPAEQVREWAAKVHQQQVGRTLARGEEQHGRQYGLEFFITNQEAEAADRRAEETRALLEQARVEATS